MLKQLGVDEGNASKTEESGIERRLAARLRQAIAVGSALEITVTLGCAAELSMFPDDAVLERCTATVRTAGQCTLVGAIWAVRHRCARGGEAVRRFSL
ncbi:SRS domain-containing protein [Cupriavidus consociatus]|uniref:SRS domain-containing protein n=1 Tax=Cupriavidus consociatus TaxID=2821357 RepID=UPI001FD7D875|nr:MULTISPECIES: SRS domain-containing protein [unclassified Cupriavidus]MDK2658342.1 SRS domain-containing protein [Cupriavidus sp. LEh21]